MKNDELGKRLNVLEHQHKKLKEAIRKVLLCNILVFSCIMFYGLFINNIIHHVFFLLFIIILIISLKPLVSLWDKKLI